MSRYNPKSSNPFEDEGDDGFVRVPSYSQSGSPFDDKRQQLSRMINESEDRQLESTQRAIASLYESEAMGNATAEELLRQREVIQNIEKKTDDINTTLTTSQRHINNIKSVFGGIKNWWTTKKEAAPAAGEQKTSSLDTIVKKNQDAASGSGTSQSAAGRGWGEEKGRGWGEGGSDYDLDSRFMAQSRSGSTASGGGGSSGLQYVQPITRSAREEELDKNLGMMSDGLGRLKMLAQGLGDEIEQQNEALDRVGPKVNRANDLLENQNRQMNRILKR